MQLNTIMGLTYSAFQQLMGPMAPPQILNPIDRLYSMQNAYFRCDDGKYHAGEDLGNWTMDSHLYIRFKFLVTNKKKN